ncbi:MAG TPA: hypothetical protein VM580_04765 [Labilithrix sp.]|nr:hypothetical protein [Labilithrix sp.]
MDPSTQGVTLMSEFVLDILAEYEHVRDVCAPAFEMARSVKPGGWVRIDLYNDVCSWIEENVGSVSMRQTGIAIGARAYEAILKSGTITAPTPLAMMEALRWAATVTVRDPRGRGWEIIESTDKSVTMRRTQTFNCTVQEGVLVSFIEKTGVEGIDVDHYTCTRRGDEFCQYRLTWV